VLHRLIITSDEVALSRYWTLREKIESTIEVKKSKFIAKGWPVKDSKQVSFEPPCHLLYHCFLTAPEILLHSVTW